MGESAYAEMFGGYEIEINNEHLLPNSPTGQSKDNWDAADRIHLTDGLLLYFSRTGRIPYLG